MLFIDARRDLTAAKSLTKLVTTTGIGCPLILITTEGGLSATNADWGFDDVILDTAGPARLMPHPRRNWKLQAQRIAADPTSGEIRSGDVVIDEKTYTAKIKGIALDLTFKSLNYLSTWHNIRKSFH